MKKILWLLPLFILPALVHAGADTLTAYLNSSRKVTMEAKPSYVRKAWKEGTLWHVKQYRIGSGMLTQDMFFTNESLTRRQGPAIELHENGMMADSAYYVEDKPHGYRSSWDNKGNQTALLHYTNGIQTDTSVQWHPNGVVSSIRICDEKGTGFEQHRAADNKTITAAGKIVEGHKQGNWIFKDSKGIISQRVEYAIDSVTSITCFDENGIEEAGKKDCKEKKTPQFSTGINGWRIFLERTMQYPREAQETKMQGVVRCRCTMDVNGKITHVEIISSPGIPLSQEATRVLLASPNWNPAEEHNRKVPTVFVQTLTFRMQ